jgi:hypothetical protein
VKSCLPLAFALVIGFFPSTAPGAGSLAARVQAAKAQRSQQQAATAAKAEIAAPLQIDAPVTRRSVEPQATELNKSPTGRINVADWLNGTADGPSAAAVVSSPPNERATMEPPRVTSSRRKTTTRPLTDQDAAPTPPTGNSVPSLDSFFTVPSESETSESAPPEPTEMLSPSSDKEPAVLQTTPSSLLELHGADNAPAATEPVATQELEESAELVVESIDEQTREETASREEAARETAEVTVMELEPREKAAPEETATDDITPVTPKKQFSASMLRLRDRNRSCLMYYYQRPENIAERSPWGVMHSLISFGVDAEVQTGRQRANAIGWLCFNRPCRSMKLLQFDGQYPVPRNGPGYQGHEGQLLSMLALSRVKATYPMRVDGHELTVQDLIDYEQVTCRPKSELTFKLIALAHYLPSDATWTSKWGQSWSIPRLIQEELTQPINGACCGGTHRLIGYSMAVKVRKKRGEPVDGQWLRAQKYTDSYHKYVIKLQNRDGSFSTSWLKKRDGSGDIDRRIQTTGHILEWLVFSLPEEELTDPRIVRAVSFLSSSMLKYRQKEWEIGPRGHALRALALYNERVFGDKPGERRALLARRPNK